jgi:hypothetical protein
VRYTLDNQTINSQPSPTLWVIDNFYQDPMAVREFALTQDFHFSDYHRGRRTEDQFEIPGTKEAFESIMGMKVSHWMETHGMCGRFQHCTCEDALVYHADAQTWAATVYLTPDAPYECGTSLLAHKKTGIRHVNTEGSDVIWANKHLDPTPWDHIDVVANVFNRLVIWDAKCPHTASKYFGYDKYDSRLFHMFFFDTE